MTVTALGRNTRTFGGESIVVERIDGTAKRFVVDLGRTTTGLHVRAVQACPDVVVLTHDDNDHIGGAATALQQLAQQCDHGDREVWLPADWLLALLALAAGLRPGLAGGWLDDFVTPEALAGDGEQSLTSPPRVHEQPDVEERHGQNEKGPDGRRRDEGNLDDVLGAVKNATNRKHRAAAEEALVIAVAEARRRWDPADVVGTAEQIAARAMRSIQRIRTIVELARASSKVRWFSPDLPPSSNLLNPHCRELWVLNAGEVRATWRPMMPNPLAVFLQMVTVVTVQNARALVTVVQPTTEQRNGVIVWSDSAGEGYADPTTVTWGDIGLMTAPHHGSTVSAHQEIWDERGSRAPEAVVLLSNNSERTTDEYRKLCGQHACTHCPTTPMATRPGRDATALWLAPWRGWELGEF